jgi:serine/threonine protein phosphatase PrpC
VPAETDHRETDLGAAGAVVTDRGVRHSRNEDAACLLLSASTAVVVAVADGVSTSDDPQKASAAAARAAAETLAAAEPSDASLEIDDAVLLAAVRRASAAVGAVTDPALLGRDGLPRAGTSVPACTLVAAHVLHAAEGARVAVVSVGDSRAYWIPESGVGEQLSVEDSWAAEQIAAGAEPDAVYADPRAHQITAWIGLDAGRLSPHLSRRRLDRPGTLLLCSDGLWNYLPDVADMTSLVRQHLSDAGGSPLAAARSLTDFARGRGGHDNITVALIPTPTDPALTMTTGVTP